MALNYWEPGWEGVLEDGTKVKTVRETDVPDSYWRMLRDKYNQFTLWQVGIFDPPKSSWVQSDHLPCVWNSGGGVDSPLRFRQSEVIHSCMVALKYLEPETNEFGIVSP
jgi:hypothetical protein